jgi:uncharacterized protein (DUF1330 family)
MAAYVILDIQVTDPELYEEYKKKAPAIVAAYAGKYLARGGNAETMEGDWSPGRIVIIEFPNLEQAKAWVASPDYLPAKALRQKSAHTRAIVVQGL